MENGRIAAKKPRVNFKRKMKSSPKSNIGMIQVMLQQTKQRP